MEQERTIIESTEDIPESICNSLLPYNIYLYWLDPNLLGVNMVNAIPFSNASTLISAQFAPYFDAADFRLIKVPYDKEKYGYDNSNINPYVYRINVLENFFNNVGDARSHPGTLEKKLGTFTAYPNIKNIGGPRSWKNESKLYNYPYSIAYLYDGLGEPIEIKFENCSSNTNNVFTRLALNINSDYSLYIENYLNDTNGEMQQNIITASRDYPCASSQYASWLATNKNQIQASKTNIIASTLTSLATGAISGGAMGSFVPGVGTAIGAVGGAALGAVNTMVSGASNLLQNQTSTNAQEKDMRNVPPSLISKGSDITLGINTTEQKLKLYTYRQKEEYLNKIGDFFAQYGYKQNKLMTPNTRNRHFYNYIKTIGSNIEATGKIPIEYLDVIKQIYNNGTTTWHVDRSNVIINDYSKDNFEV